MKRIYVVHDEGDGLGLRPVEFPNKEQAIIARDVWNKEIEGHSVVVIDESSKPNAGAVPRRGSDVGTSPLLGQKSEEA